MCQMRIIVNFSMAIISCNTLVIIAYDRLRIIRDGINYVQNRTIPSILQPVMFLWFIGFWLVLDVLFDFDRTVNYSEEKNRCSRKTATHMLNSLFVVLPASLLIIIYWQIYSSLKEKGIKLTNVETTNGTARY